MSEQQSLSSCCVTGHLHTGTPLGEVEKIADLDTYVTKPEGGSKTRTIIFLTDIFGWNFPNARLLADEFAKAGFYVVVPDVFQGDHVPHDLLNVIIPKTKPTSTETAKVVSNHAPWLERHREAVTKPLIDKFLSSLRADPEVKKIGAIGYCFGGRYVLVLAKEGAIDAGVSNHPSSFSFPSDFEITKPTLVLNGDDDPFMPLSQVKQVEALWSSYTVPNKVTVVPGAVHGFAVRGDIENDEEKKRKDDAAEDAIKWFNKYLV